MVKLVRCFNCNICNIIEERDKRVIIYCNNYNNNTHTVHNNKTKKRS